MPVIVTSGASSRWHAAPAAVFAAIAVWLSTGAMAFRTPFGVRIGVLPIAALPFATAVLAAAIVFAVGARRPRGAAIAVSPLVLVLIPWLPVTLPPALLIWTGATTVPLWIGVALALAAVPLSEGAWHAHSLTRPRTHVRLAFAAGCIVFGLAAWSASAAIPGGDEPHYLVITQSLLHDHDLNVENNYANGDYRAYYGGPLGPDFRVRGRHGELYSFHAPGIPALVLPAFAVAGYHGVVVFLVIVSAAASALAWWLAWCATTSVAAAWFGWASVALAAPFLLESFTVYPDAPGAAIVLTAFWALRRLDRAGASESAVSPWNWHGAALAALPWMHTRFAVLAVLLGGFIVVRLLRTRHASLIAAFLAVPVLSAAAWVAASVVMYGTPNPAAPYGGQSDTSLAFLPNGIGGLLFDQGFGLIATAPALLVAGAGLARMRRFAFEWGLLAVVYGAAVGSYAMWWAGTSGPARFLVPLLLPLAVPAAVAWHSTTSRGGRVAMMIALAVTAWLSAVLAGAGGGFLAYHGRNVYGMTAAPWLGWVNTLVDLSQALPAFVPLPRGTPLGARVAATRDGFAALTPWVACFAVALYAIVHLGRKPTVRLYAIVAASFAAFAAATMIAASIVWWMHGGLHPAPLDAQLDLLRQLSHGRTIALDVMKARPLSGIEALNMRLDVALDEDPRSATTRASIPLLPPAAYRITPRGALAGTAAILAGADDEPFPLSIVSPAVFARGVSLDLPVAIRALTIRGPSGSAADSVELRPYAVRTFAGSRNRAEDVAHHAAAYGNINVFFLDDRTAPEEDGFWIWGNREGRVVFSSTSATPVITLRNGAVQNDVTVRVADDHEQPFSLRPGEERQVTLPTLSLDAAYLVTIRSASGFRPADVDPRSRDRRLLGVYVVMPDHAVR